MEMTTPVWTPQLLFCATLSFSVVRTLPALVRFYAWFSKSGLEIAKHRGYGQTSSRFYGLFSAPRLSVQAMAASGALFVVCLTLPNLPLVPATWHLPLFGLALIFYHLFFSQLYCEAHVGAHVTVFVPPALILLGLAPRVEHASGQAGELEERAAAFTAWLAKLVLCSAYCSAGVSKIASSVKARRAWWDGATLQASIFEALLLCRKGTHFSFGVPTPFAHEAQVFAYLHPRLLLAPLSFLAVALEAAAPLVLLLAPDVASLPFAVAGLSFHYGIAYFQNVDFVSWWGPFYAFFLLDPAASAAAVAAPELFGPLGATCAALQVAPLRAGLALGYVAAHLAAMVALHFFPSVEMLPFSCFPMFKGVKDLFCPGSRKWVWLSDKPHATGTLKNYCFPFCRPQCVRADELDQLPFKYLLFGHGGSDEEVLYANFVVGGELRELLWKIRAEGCSGAGASARDPEAARRLLGLLREAQAAFDRAERPSPMYTPPVLTATPSEATQEKCAETESTCSASTRSASATVAEARKLVVFDDIMKNLYGSRASVLARRGDEEPLRVLCTNARIFQEVVSQRDPAEVAVTLLTDNPEDVRVLSRSNAQGHCVVFGPLTETIAQLSNEAKAFDAAFVEQDLVSLIPTSVLAVGARIVVAGSVLPASHASTKSGGPTAGAGVDVLRAAFVPSP